MQGRASGPLHTRDWGPVTRPLQALSLVGNAEPVRVRLPTTLDGPTEYVNCKMDVKSTGLPTWHEMDHVSWLLGLFSKPSFGDKSNTKPGDCGIPNAHNRWFILFNHVWRPAWIDIHWNNIWLKDGHIWLHTRAQHFPSNLYPYPDHIHQQRPMLTHAYPCYSNCTHVCNNCVMCITPLHQVLVGSDK